MAFFQQQKDGTKRTHDYEIMYLKKITSYERHKNYIILQRGFGEATKR